MAKITYVPLDPTDPNHTEIHGIKFKANVAVTVDDDHPTAQEKGREISLPDLLDGNSSFQVERDGSAPVKGKRGRKPKSGSDEASDGDEGGEGEDA